MHRSAVFSVCLCRPWAGADGVAPSQEGNFSLGRIVKAAELFFSSRTGNDSKRRPLML